MNTFFRPSRFGLGACAGLLLAGAPSLASAAGWHPPSLNARAPAPVNGTYGQTTLAPPGGYVGNAPGYYVPPANAYGYPNAGPSYPGAGGPTDGRFTADPRFNGVPNTGATVGVHCATPLGLAGIPPTAVGAPCAVNGPNGTIFGQVIP